MSKVAKCNLCQLERTFLLFFKTCVHFYNLRQLEGTKMKLSHFKNQPPRALSIFPYTSMYNYNLLHLLIHHPSSKCTNSKFIFPLYKTNIISNFMKIVLKAKINCRINDGLIGSCKIIWPLTQPDSVKQVKDSIKKKKKR